MAHSTVLVKFQLGQRKLPPLSFWQTRKSWNIDCNHYIYDPTENHYQNEREKIKVDSSTLFQEIFGNKTTYSSRDFDSIIV